MSSDVDYQGPCGDLWATTRWHVCQLPYGHAGHHQDTRPDAGAVWPPLKRTRRSMRETWENQ